MAPDTADFVAAIFNDSYPVRQYAPQRTPTMRLRRAQAIQKLGLTVRDAFSRSDDFEALLGAVVDGLRPRNDQPF